MSLASSFCPPSHSATRRRIRIALPATWLAVAAGAALGLALGGYLFWAMWIRPIQVAADVTANVMTLISSSASSGRIEDDHMRAAASSANRQRTLARAQSIIRSDQAAIRNLDLRIEGAAGAQRTALIMARRAFKAQREASRAARAVALEAVVDADRWPHR